MTPPRIHIKDCQSANPRLGSQINSTTFAAAGLFLYPDWQGYNDAVSRICGNRLVFMAGIE